MIVGTDKKYRIDMIIYMYIYRCYELGDIIVDVNNRRQDTIDGRDDCVWEQYITVALLFIV